MLHNILHKFKSNFLYFLNFCRIRKSLINFILKNILTHLNIFLAVVKNLEQNKDRAHFHLCLGRAHFIFCPSGLLSLLLLSLCANTPSLASARRRLSLRQGFSPQQEDQGKNGHNGKREGEHQTQLRTACSAGGRSRWVASCPPGFNPWIGLGVSPGLCLQNKF